MIKCTLTFLVLWIVQTNNIVQMNVSEKHPFVSVVMPTYNVGKYIEEAVQSILNQTFLDFEFIIVDDGSTDHTPEILRSFSDPRIRLLFNEKNEEKQNVTAKRIRECHAPYYLGKWHSLFN